MTVNGSSTETVAFVLSGGANLGAVHVGMLRALMEAGVEPDLLVGTSAGALNAAYIASRWSADGIAGLDDVWVGMRRQEIFPTRLLGGLLGFVGRADHLVPNSGLRRLIRRHLQFDRLEQAPIPLHVVATDVLTGADQRFSTGTAIDSILASSAIPAVFPPITIDGATYIDGGVVDNTPISHAVDLGATTIWVLPAGTACGLDSVPTSALAMALQAISLLINRRLQRDIDEFHDVCDIRVLPPLCPVVVHPTDFDHARDLIDRSYEQSTAWIRSGLGERSESRVDLSAALAHPHE